jgi:hypothetical protein
MVLTTPTVAEDWESYRDGVMARVSCNRALLGNSLDPKLQHRYSLEYGTQVCDKRDRMAYLYRPLRIIAQLLILLNWGIEEI